MADPQIEGLAEAHARALPCQAEKCAGCAFQPGTIANRWRTSGHTAGQIWLNLHRAIKGEIGFSPFFCHEGHTQEEREDFHEHGDQGAPPDGFKVCAGWLEEIGAERARQAEGNGDIGEFEAGMAKINPI